MLRPEYCLVRAERLRLLMLAANDPAAAVRLRGFVQSIGNIERRKRSILGRSTERCLLRPPQLVLPDTYLRQAHRECQY
jgi:hypothetical protein